MVIPFTFYPLSPISNKGTITMKRTTTESTYNNHTIMTNKERWLLQESFVFGKSQHQRQCTERAAGVVFVKNSQRIIDLFNWWRYGSRIGVKQGGINFRFMVFPLPLLRLKRKYSLGNRTIQNGSFKTLYREMRYYILCKFRS